jgi:hypothetical protein
MTNPPVLDRFRPGIAVSPYATISTQALISVNLQPYECLQPLEYSIKEVIAHRVLGVVKQCIPSSPTWR